MAFVGVDVVGRESGSGVARMSGGAQDLQYKSQILQAAKSRSREKKKTADNKTSLVCRNPSLLFIQTSNVEEV